MSNLKMKERKRKRIFVLMFAFCLLGITVFLGYRWITQISAEDKSWVQSDWSGPQSDDIITEDSNSYKAQENISLGTVLSVDHKVDWSTDHVDWNFRKKIIFDNTEENIGASTEDLVNFPVLVRLDNTVIDYTETEDSGKDIRFLDRDGENLSYEIEDWDESATSYIWVKVPQIDQDSDTDYIYMYYGNPSATDEQNSSDVWEENDYQAVWHLNEDSGLVRDSGPLGYNGTAVGVNQGENGYNGKGVFTDGSNSYIDFSISLGNTVTIETWAKSTASSFQDMLWCIGSNNRGPDLFFSGSKVSLNTWDSSNNPFCNIPTGVGGWNLYTTVISPSTTRLYVNNTLCGSAGYRNPTTNNFHIASHANYDWEGYVDEFRISTVARSQAWTYANYASQSGGFSTYSDKERVYSDTAYLESNIFDTGHPSDWGTLSYTTTVSDSVTVKVRSSNSQTMSEEPVWSSCDPITLGSDISSNNCVRDEHTYLQYRIDFDMTGQEAPPVFEDISITYSASDKTEPSLNAHDVYMENITEDGTWINFEPTIRWSEGDDDRGLLGYYISLTELGISVDPESPEPTTSSGKLSNIDDGVDDEDSTYIVTDTYIDLSTIDGLSLESNKKYYFSIQAVDLAGNYWKEDPQGYQNLLYFKYDDTKPNNVMYISTPSSTFGSINDMFFSWPVGEPAGAFDLQSDILGWQYAINSTAPDRWMGSQYEDFLDIQYIPSGSAQVINLTENLHTNHIVVGNNTIYFRSIDKAGNVSTYATGGISYGGKAPTFPAESIVGVTPEESDKNNFALSWPEATAGEGREIDSYYYMINTQPPTNLVTLKGNSSVYIPIRSTERTAGVITGAIKGVNHVYVVAVDDQGNYSPSSFIHGQFNLDSNLPDPPLNLTLSDTSIKEAEIWRVALTWDEPVYKGNGNISYIVEKSIDGKSWYELSRINGNAYSDTSSLSKKYFYKVASIDSSDESKNSPTYTSILNIEPKGRFTTPPSLISRPTIVDLSSRRAQVRWATDRMSDSKIQYGVSSGEYFESEIYTSTPTTEHVLDMNNLLPGTVYYIKARWTDEDGNTGSSDEFFVETKSAPRVEDVKISTVGLEYAILDITTKGSVKANILYGKTKTYGGSKEINTSTAISEYSVMLTELEDGTEYHYTIILTDEEGYEYDGFGDLVFETPPRPQVSNVQIQEKKGVPTPTIEVFWKSNIAVNSIVRYSSKAKTLDKVDMELVKGEHRMEISGLDPDSSYQLTVEGVDAMGNRAVSAVHAFTTATDTRPPEISSIRSEGDIQSSDIQSDRSRSAQLIISWETDEPSSSQVLYGEGAGNDGYPYSTQTDSEMRTKHVIIVSNLTPSKVYHFKVVSKDNAGNVGESGSVTSITPKSTDTVMESVLGSLGRIFKFF